MTPRASYLSYWYIWHRLTQPAVANIRYFLDRMYDNFFVILMFLSEMFLHIDYLRIWALRIQIVFSSIIWDGRTTHLNDRSNETIWYFLIIHMRYERFNFGWIYYKCRKIFFDSWKNSFTKIFRKKCSLRKWNSTQQLQKQSEHSKFFSILKFFSDSFLFFKLNIQKFQDSTWNFNFKCYKQLITLIWILLKNYVYLP